MADVVCIGNLVVDVVTKVDKYPGLGKLVLSEPIEQHLGGCSANTALALARIGVDCALIGRVGNDQFGDFILRELSVRQPSGATVDYSNVLRDPHLPTSGTIVLVGNKGERSLIHHVGANSSISAKDIPWSLIHNSKVLSIGGFFAMPGLEGEPLADVLGQVKKRKPGIYIVLDTVYDVRGSGIQLLKPCLPYVDFFVPSLLEARQLTGERKEKQIAAKLLQYGAKAVIIKLGARGALLATPNGEPKLIPAFQLPTDRVENTLGAGDCWVAGFVTGLLDKEMALEDCVQLGNAAGALCVLDRGPTEGVPPFRQLMDFMRSTPLTKVRLR